jgi:hypothetical protein
MKNPDGSANYNLDTLTFENWINFAFNHPAKATPKEVPWHHLVEWSFKYNNSLHQLKNCVRLFENTSLIENFYSWVQIDEGLWFLLWNVAEHLVEDEDLPLNDRKELIESMVLLYKNLFINQPFTTSPFMWWDSICYSYFIESNVSKDEQDIREIIFPALKTILEIDSIKCQVAALHGMGHLRHKDTKSVIREYLIEHPSLTKEVIGYAEGCINGTMDRMAQPLKELK